MSAGLKVECYSGYKFNERPLAFSLNKRKLQVKEIIDQWYGPEYTYFKIMAEDENTYILRFNERDDHWEVVFFEERNYHPVTYPETWKHTPST